MKINFNDLNENTIVGLEVLGSLNLSMIEKFKIGKLTRNIIEESKDIEKLIRDKREELQNLHGEDVVMINKCLEMEIDSLYSNIEIDYDLEFKLDRLVEVDKDNKLTSKNLDGINFLINE